MSEAYQFHMASTVHKTIEMSVSEVTRRIDTFGFTVWPFAPDLEHGIPLGFCSVGMTRAGLPEVYVSGISAHSTEGEEIITGLKRLYDYAIQAEGSMPAMQLCMEINQKYADQETKPLYQWRPVDPVRLMYGQSTIIRHWAESVDAIENVQGIQIVHRDERGEFPFKSAIDQLLLDWIPFGTASYIFPEEVIDNVPAI